MRWIVIIDRRNGIHMNLAIIECRTCGAAYWVEAWIGDSAGGAVDGGPCCFGHEVLDIERFPSEKAAAKAMPAWDSNRLENMRRVWREYHREAA